MGSLQQAFDERVAIVPFSTCHYWTGQVNGDGYGLFNRRRASHLALELAGRPLPGQIDGKRAVARHRCDTPLCVNPDHLEHGTQADNMRDKAERDRAPMKEHHHGAKLKEGDAEAICAAVDAGERVTDVAARYGITPGRVSMIRYGQTRWCEVKTPTARSDRRLTDEQVLEIYSSSLNYAELGRIYGLSAASIRDLKTGRTYFKITGARG